MILSSRSRRRGRDTGGVLIILAVQSPARQRSINGTQFSHQRSQAVNHLLCVAGVFDGMGKIRSATSRRSARLVVGGKPISIPELS